MNTVPESFHRQNYVHSFNPSQLYTVCFGEYGNWTFFKDGEVMEGWEAWSAGLSWEEAHDACCRFR